MALYGIYGRHEIEDCPWNNEKTGKQVIQASKGDPSKNLPKYKINDIKGRFHSGLEHTFLWILEAEDPHLIQTWAVENGIAKFNEIKIVPLITFDGVVAGAKRIWEN